jgi:hypothetical protein
MINKLEYISVGVYWDDVGIPGWKLSGWSNTRATISFKNCENYSRSTLNVARYLRSYWDRRADAGCFVLLRAPAQERPWKSEGPTPRCTNINTIIFRRKSKTAMRKPAHDEDLLYLYFKQNWVVLADDPARQGPQVSESCLETAQSYRKISLCSL